MFKLKDSKQTLTGVVADSFRLLNKTWAANVVVVLIYYIAYFIIQWIFNRESWKVIFHPATYMASQPSSAVNANSSMMVISSSAIPMQESLALVIIGSILSFWILLIFKAILVRSCWNTASKGSADLGNAFKMGLKYFHVYFIKMVIYFIAFLILGIIVALFNLIGLSWLTAVVAIIAATIFYFILIKLVLVEAMAMIESCGIKAIGRSWKITSAKWWRTLGTIVYSSVFFTVMMLLAGIGIFLVVVLPGLFGQLANTITTMIHEFKLPHWFMVLYFIDIVVTFVSILFTLPTMNASSEVVLVNDLKHR